MQPHSFFTFIAIHSAPPNSRKKARIDPFSPLERVPTSLSRHSRAKEIRHTRARRGYPAAVSTDAVPASQPSLATLTRAPPNCLGWGARGSAQERWRQARDLCAELGEIPAASAAMTELRNCEPTLGQCLFASQSPSPGQKPRTTPFESFSQLLSPSRERKNVASFILHILCASFRPLEWSQKARFTSFKAFAQCLFASRSHPPGGKARAPECGLIHSLHSGETLWTPSDAPFTRSWTERIRRSQAAPR